VKRWIGGGIAVVVGIALALGGYFLQGAQSAPAQMTFYVIAHTGPGDPFWAVVQKGVQDAGKLLGVRAIFQGPPQRDIPAQVNMARAAINAKATGIAISVSDPKAICAVIREARGKGIPVVAINVKQPPEFTEPCPYEAYIGMDEYEAGKNVARFMLPKLPKGARVLIPIHEPGHVGLEARAKGITEVLTQELGATVEKLDITQDPTKALAALRAYFKAHPDTKAMFTLGPLGAIPAIKMLKEDKLVGKVLMASFDLDPQTIQAIKEGVVLATVDQQQYLQGFISVIELWLNAKYKLQPADYNTGRGLVTKETAAAVETLVKQGYR
jgi:simple sugar transport system substrate-binding protein